MLQFEIRADGTNIPIIDGRKLENIALTDEQRDEVLRTYNLQPQEWGGHSNPCKSAGCAGRNLICHATCPAYLAYRVAADAANAEKLRRQEANHVTMKTVAEKARLARTLNRNAKITKSL